MKSKIKAVVLAVFFSVLCGCDQDASTSAADAGIGESARAESADIAALGCATVASPFPVVSLEAVQQHGALVPGVFTRPLFPTLFRQGPWTAANFVRDSQGLTFPAIISTGLTGGWMSIPFQSGEILTGFSVWACGNGQTAMFFDGFATITADEFGDSIDAIGSGGMIAVPNVWTSINLTIPPVLMHSNSMVYLQLQATSPNASPPSMAVASVIPHFQ